MKKLLILTLVTLFSNSTFSEEAAHHHHEKNTNESLFLNDGKKWTVDQTMQENMEAIHTGYKKLNQLISSKKVTEKDFTELSNLISTATNKIVQNCKLEEKADKTYHVILAELLNISNEITDAKKSKQALKNLAHTLKRYSNYFDHSFSK